MRFALLLLAALAAGCSKSKEQRQAAVDRARTAEAAARMEQVGNALGFCSDLLGHFPSGTLTPDGRPGLSWRVEILPYIQEDELYKSFRFNEPWDSEHNKALIPRMPALYATPGTAAPPGYTHLRSFAAVAGPHKAFMPGPTEFRRPASPISLSAQGRTLADITDAKPNTLVLAEAAEAVVWTKPGELEYHPSKPPPKLGAVPGGFLGFMADGRAHLFPENMPDTWLRLLITINDGKSHPRELDALVGGETLGKHKR